MTRDQLKKIITTAIKDKVPFEEAFERAGFSYNLIVRRHKATMAYILRGIAKELLNKNPS